MLKVSGGLPCMQSGMLCDAETAQLQTICRMTKYLYLFYVCQVNYIYSYIAAGKYCFILALKDL